MFHVATSPGGGCKRRPAGAYPHSLPRSGCPWRRTRSRGRRCRRFLVAPAEYAKDLAEESLLLLVRVLGGRLRRLRDRTCLLLPIGHRGLGSRFRLSYAEHLLEEVA